MTDPTVRSTALLGRAVRRRPGRGTRRPVESTHFDWRLARYDIAGSRAHAQALRRAGLLTDGEMRALVDALELLDADVAAGGSSPAPTTRTCTPHSSEAARAGRRRARREAARRPVPQRPDRHADPDVPARPGPVVAGRSLDARGRAGRRRPTPPRRPMPGRTHLQHAQPVLLAHHLLAHAWPLMRDVERLRDWDAARRSRRTARARWPARRSAWTPRRSPPSSDSTGRPRTPSTAPPRATSSPSSPSSPR